MAYRLPPLTWLRAFEAAARHMSFTDAAEELHLTQAAVSKQVKLLEQTLREPLFLRRARSLALTRAGEAYLPKVQDAFDRLGAGTAEVFGTRRAEMLTVRVQVGFAVNWLAPRLPGFLDAHPRVPLRIVSSVWAEEVEAGRHDLDIQYGTGHWPGFRVDPLVAESLQPVCRADVAARLAAPADLARERLLHVVGYQQGWATWLDAAGTRGVNAGSGVHFDTSLMALEVAAQGGGVALGRRSMADKEVAQGRLVRPFALAVPVAEGFHLISPEEGMAHPDSHVFRAWLLGQVAERQASGG
jgi:LysR family transcriptional regulator, glycine cleavage system transcriptional activator